MSFQNKKSTKVGSNIFANEATANVDYKYGPYASIDEAYATLCEDNLDVIAVGLTVGIMTENGVVEYWFKKGTTKQDLVLKGIDPSVMDKITALEQENAKLKEMLSLEDEDGNGIPDGEDRLRIIENSVVKTSDIEDTGTYDDVF